jgi:serine/threonine protein kinase/Tol biopolymer transport system component
LLARWAYNLRVHVMTTSPDRWATVERVYHAAVARPLEARAAFLAEACAGDDALRREVESLLAQDVSAAGPLTRGAVVAAADLVSNVGHSVLTGRRIGAYQILAPIGAGGMGEVYRARDTRLGREVAVKILPRAFTSDADRLARFEREARVLASLNHPHIATIHGIEDAPLDGGAPVRALILELVEGETLAERIARTESKGLPIKEALDIARQIADALDAAHEKGIVHRDLKPANIKITPQGVVKVLDFGLAKLETSSSESADGVTAAPTITVDDTREGLIVGTAAYMSPEQARGQAVDKRTDIWAFGCVLYEMLTGRSAFTRATISDTIAGVLEREPDWAVLPTNIPPPIFRLIPRCLQKDIGRRLHDVADARIELDDAIEPQSTTNAPTAPLRRSKVGAIVLAALSATALVVAGAVIWLNRPITVAKPSTVQFVATGGYAHALEPSGLDCDVALSPDGRRLAYAAGGPGRVQLVTRSLAQLNSSVLWDRGTPRSPFFSPDGEWIGFFEQFGALRKIPATGGPSIQVSRAVGGAARGATWASDGSIIFATSSAETGLWRVSANGGEPQVLTRPAIAQGELDHFWPEMLPGGNAVLFTIVSVGTSNRMQIAVFNLKTGRSKVLIRGGTHARYVSSGHLLYGSAGSAFLVPFDIDTLTVTGDAVKVLDRVAITPDGAVNAAIAEDGTLAYVPSDAAAVARTLVWVDRTGREEEIPAPPRAYLYPRLSPDATRIAVESWDEDRDIWIWNIARQTLTRVTDNPDRDGFPIWTTDGRRIIFGSAHNVSTNLFWRAAESGDSPVRLTDSAKIQFPYSVSPDGARLLFREDDTSSGLDIDILDLENSSVTVPFIRTPFNEVNAEFSPDGRWVAYQSNESGQEEIYVRPFADGGTRWQISTMGGTRPVWARSGRELFYLATDGIYAVPIGSGSSFAAGRPALLIKRRYFATTAFLGRTYDVAADGQRFLMVKPASATEVPQIIVASNWLVQVARSETR